MEPMDKVGWLGKKYRRLSLKKLLEGIPVNIAISRAVYASMILREKIISKY